MSMIFGHAYCNSFNYKLCYQMICIKVEVQSSVALEHTKNLVPTQCTLTPRLKHPLSACSITA